MASRLVGILSLASLLTAGAVVSSHAADRPPTAEERAKIEAVLKQAGFVSWDEIELEAARKWEVDDARRVDGTKWDLDLSADSLEIIRRKPD